MKNRGLITRIRTTVGKYQFELPQKEREAFREATDYLGLDISSKIMVLLYPEGAEEIITRF